MSQASTPSAPDDKGWLTFQGRLPIVMLLGLVAQMGLTVWQAGQITNEVAQHGRRLDRLEMAREETDRKGAERGERLAGILAGLEAAVTELRGAVERLERRAGGR